AVLSVLNGNVPFRTTSIALFLSLDTLLFTDYMMNEGGSTTPVYGYGWGALVWFLSLCLLLVAVGIREIEIAKSKNIHSSSLVLILIGIFIGIVALSSAGYLYKADRAHANTVELKRLENVIYKIGNVCSVEQPRIAHPIKNFSGTLAVTIYTSGDGASFFNLKEYLNSGIPKVRVNGVDYFYEATKNGKILVSESALTSEQAQAVLYISEDSYHNINARLIEQSSGRVVFDQAWTRTYLKSYLIYCPEYYSTDNKNYPWKLLLEALNLNPDVSSNKLEQNSTNFTEPVNLEILPNDGDEVKQYNKSKIDSKWSNPAKTTSNSFSSDFNQGCGARVRLDAPENEPMLSLGRPFRINNKSYYLGNFDVHNVQCDNEFLYLYGMHESTNSFLVSLKVRKISDFTMGWDGNFKIQGLPNNISPALLEVNSVSLTANQLIIEVFYARTGETIYLKAPSNALKLE
ncbi:MAG TPA: hypothetical protein VGJ90_03785, partial [Methylophilaceae bacterium]